MADVPATEPTRLGPAKTIAKKVRRVDDSLSRVAVAEALRKDVDNVETVDEAPGPGDTTSRKDALEEKNDGDVKGEEDQELEGEAEKEDNSRRKSPEYDVKHPTGDAMRDKVRGLLANALATGKDGGAGDEESVIAAAIEQGMFKKFDGNGAPYKTKYRTISFNLKDKKNGKLRAAIMRREILPSELLEMTSEELANEELKKTREKVHEKMTRDAMPYNQPAATTNQFKCGKCKQRKCTYFQMQTRSADEPLTTFVSCVNCGNRWKF